MILLYNYCTDMMGINTILNFFLPEFPRAKEKWILDNMNIIVDNYFKPINSILSINFYSMNY